MPQLVWMQPRDTHGGGGGVERATAEDAVSQRAPTAHAREHEIIASLALDVASQILHQEPGQRHLTSLVGFRCPPDETHALHVGYRLGDESSPASEVKSANPQTCELAEPNPGIGEEENCEAIHLILTFVVAPVLADDDWMRGKLSETIHLAVGQISILGLHDPWEVDPDGHVP